MEINQDNLNRVKYTQILKVLDIANTIIIIYNAQKNFKIEFVSESITKLGYTVSEITDSNFLIEELINPHDLFRVKEFHKQMVKNHLKQFQIEYEILDRNQNPILIQENTRIDYTPNGEPSFVSSAFTDISKIKSLEKELTHSEQNYQTILRDSLFGILIFQNEQVCFANQFTGKILGYDLKEIMDWNLQNYFRIIHPEDAPRAFKYMESYKEGLRDKIQIHYRIHQKNKNIRWIDHISHKTHYNGKVAHFITIFDISERIVAQEKLKASELKFRNFISNLNESVLITDKNYKITYFNQQFEYLFRYDESEILTSKIDKFFWKGYSSSEIDQISQIWKNGVKNELRFQKSNNEILYGLLSPSNLYDVNGEFSGIISIITDISARKQMETKLRENELRYRSLFESASDGIMIIKDGVFVDSNDKIFEIFERTREEMIGLTPIDISPEFQPNLVPSDVLINKRIHDTLYGSSPFFEWTFLKKNGSELVTEIRLNKVTIDHQIYLQSIIRDITKRKKMEQLIAAEKEKLSIALQSMADGMIITNIEGKIDLINKVAADLTGWSQESAKGCDIDLVFNIAGEKTSISPIFSIKSILTLKKTLAFPKFAQLLSNNDVVRIITGTASPILNEENNIQGIVVIFRDVTEKRRMESELVKSQKMESVGLLAGGIAHDFNNILTSILGNLSIAKLELGESNNEVYGILEEAEKASIRANKLTKQLLTFSKGGSPIKKTVSIRESMYETVRFALRGSNVQYFIEIAEDLWSVNIDEGQISQVINNIVINADQAMPNGGNIIIEAKNHPSSNNTFQLPAKTDYIHIIIMDQGTGIPQEDLTRIFDPYYTTKENGTGLGLAVCYSIVKNHNGVIIVDSKLDEGTIFHIFLPASGDSTVLERKSVKPSLIQGSGRILVMDDEENILNLLSKMVHRLGYTVVKTKEGRSFLKEAKEALEKNQPFDYYIMDLTIPGGMGGKDAVGKLLDIFPNAKTIVSSGYQTGKVMAEYKKYGFKGVLIKPYTITDLSKILAQIH